MGRKLGLRKIISDDRSRRYSRRALIFTGLAGFDRGGVKTSTRPGQGIRRLRVRNPVDGRAGGDGTVVPTELLWERCETGLDPAAAHGTLIIHGLDGPSVGLGAEAPPGSQLLLSTHAGH